VVEEPKKFLAVSILNGESTANGLGGGAFHAAKTSAAFSGATRAGRFDF